MVALTATARELYFYEVLGLESDDSPTLGGQAVMSEAWPSSVTLFDPADVYGTERLVSIEMVYEAMSAPADTDE